ncbi:MAG: methyl-accepting chemotaxis protein [Deltaproteobacteria bacterium]|nr:methyl-accepting chemotaxis protein [Deltaproteobacteria bacterium]
MTRLFDKKHWPLARPVPSAGEGRAALPGRVQVGANKPESQKTRGQFDLIARASVWLAALGPRLVGLAVEMEQKAQAQAAQATGIAAVMEGLAADLDRAVKELRASSGQVENALATVSRIAEHTRMISINASIEAARAGEHGVAFGVVVDEVRRLADRTGETTGLIEQSIQDMRQSIVQVREVSGSEKTAADRTGTVAAVSTQVSGMAHLADQQMGVVESLRGMCGQINGYTEQLLMGLGTFRFEAHKRAEEEIAEVLPRLSRVFGNRKSCEAMLDEWLADHPSFELAYLTDERGRQCVDNIGRQEKAIVHDPDSFGRDWSKRPWYLEAIRQKGLHSTDIYRSTATGDFCFTVAAGLSGPEGNTLGVLGADVNFQRLLEDSGPRYKPLAAAITPVGP